MIYKVTGTDWNHFGVSQNIGVWYFNSVLRALEFTNMFMGVRWHFSSLED